MNTKLFSIATALLFTMIWLGSCTYHSEEIYFGEGKNDCDTSSVSYSGHIAPIMVLSCNSCHGLSFPQGGVVTADYAGLSVVAASGALVGAVYHQSGYVSMPPSQPQLDSCSLKRIAAWVNQGFQDN
jgi:hypothetical protein